MEIDLPAFHLVKVDPCRRNLKLAAELVNLQPVLLAPQSTVVCSTVQRSTANDETKCNFQFTPTWMRTASIPNAAATVTIRGVQYNGCKARCLGSDDIVMVLFLDALDLRYNLGMRLYDVNSGALLPVVFAQRDTSCPLNREGDALRGRAVVIENGDVLDVCIVSAAVATDGSQ